MERMIEETATVVETADGIAWVETVRHSSCSHCGSASSCGTASLAKVLGQGRSRLQITDTLGLRNGEQVVIGIPGDTLVRAALAAYMLPLIIMIFAAGLASAQGWSDGYVALAGLAGLVLGLFASRAISGGARGRAHYRPTLIRRGSITAPVHCDAPTL